MICNKSHFFPPFVKMRSSTIPRFRSKHSISFSRFSFAKKKKIIDSKRLKKKKKLHTHTKKKKKNEYYYGILSI